MPPLQSGPLIQVNARLLSRFPLCLCCGLYSYSETCVGSQWMTGPFMCRSLFATVHVTGDNRAMSDMIAGDGCQRVFAAANGKVSGAYKPVVQHFVVILTPTLLEPQPEHNLICFKTHKSRDEYFQERWSQLLYVSFKNVSFMQNCCWWLLLSSSVKEDTNFAKLILIYVIHSIQSMFYSYKNLKNHWYALPKH